MDTPVELQALCSHFYLNKCVMLITCYLSDLKPVSSSLTHSSTSEAYAPKPTCMNGVELVKNNAPAASVLDISILVEKQLQNSNVGTPDS